MPDWKSPTNQPPSEITTPPEGYEWTGEYRQAKQDDWWARPRVGTVPAEKAYEAAYGKTILAYGILRKIKPPTVMVELPREWVETAAAFDKGDIMQACRAALEAEES